MNPEASGWRFETSTRGDSTRETISRRSRDTLDDAFVPPEDGRAMRIVERDIDLDHS